MRLSVSTEGVTIAAEADGAAAAEASSQASTNGAGPETEGGIRTLIKSLSGKIAGGSSSNGAAGTGPAAVEKVCLQTNSKSSPTSRVQEQDKNWHLGCHPNPEPFNNVEH